MTSGLLSRKIMEEILLFQSAIMNQDEDNGVIPEKEERPSIDIKEEEVFTTETPLNSLKLDKTPKLLSCKVSI